MNDELCNRGVRVEIGRQCRRSQRCALTHGASPPSLDRSFFIETTVLLTSEQWCACQEMQSWRVHVASFDRWSEFGSRVTERARPSRNDDRFRSSLAAGLVFLFYLFARDALLRRFRSRNREAKRAHAAITLARFSWIPPASRRCNRPAKHVGNQWRASIGYRRSSTR